MHFKQDHLHSYKRQENACLFFDFIKEHEFEILPPNHETNIMSTIDEELFFTLIKNTGIRDLDESCHIKNNDTGMYCIIGIDEPV